MRVCWIWCLRSSSGSASGTRLWPGTKLVFGLGCRFSGPVGMVLGRAQRFVLRPVACFRLAVDGFGSWCSRVAVGGLPKVRLAAVSVGFFVGRLGHDGHGAWWTCRRQSRLVCWSLAEDPIPALGPMAGDVGGCRHRRPSRRHRCIVVALLPHGSGSWENHRSCVIRRWRRLGVTSPVEGFILGVGHR